MKKSFNTLWKSFLGLLLSVLGFGACTDKSGGGWADEYGAPSALFKVKGKIYVENTDEKIEGIKVVFLELAKNWKTDSTYAFGVDSTYTTKDGEFNLKYHDTHGTNTFLLKIEDVDGGNNGSWETRIDTVKYENPVFTNGDGWFRGETEKDLGIIYLEPKQSEE